MNTATPHAKQAPRQSMGEFAAAFLMLMLCMLVFWA